MAGGPWRYDAAQTARQRLQFQPHRIGVGLVTQTIWASDLATRICFRAPRNATHADLGFRPAEEKNVPHSRHVATLPVLLREVCKSLAKN